MSDVVRRDRPFAVRCGARYMYELPRRVDTEDDPSTVRHSSFDGYVALHWTGQNLRSQ